MRKVLIAAATLLTLAACSAQPSSYEAGPDISPTAAPGVKFSYRYAFILPDDGIAQVQEQHAQTCERLGPAKCRITGMRYTVVASDEVRGMLAMRLDPEIARQFGKQGADAVVKASGSLVESEIEGVVGAAPPTPAAEGEDAAPPLPAEVAAMTPMVFEYNGGVATTGLGGGRISAAFATATASFVTMASVIVIAVGGGAPWALALIGGLLAWRSEWARRLRGRLTGDPAAA